MPIVFLSPLLSVVCALTHGACTCVPRAEPRTAAEASQYVEGSAVVFDGVVVRITHPSLREAAADPRGATTLTVTLRVKRQWRGVASDSVIVTTSMFAESCGVDFEVGRSYFVIADAFESGPVPQSGANQSLSARSCGASRPRTQARDLERLLDAP